MSNGPPAITGPELARALQSAGFRRTGQTDSHISLEHDQLHVTIPMNENRPLHQETVAAILRSCAMSTADVRALESLDPRWRFFAFDVNGETFGS